MFTKIKQLGIRLRLVQGGLSDTTPGSHRSSWTVIDVDSQQLSEEAVMAHENDNEVEECKKTALAKRRLSTNEEHSLTQAAEQLVNAATMPETDYPLTNTLFVNPCFCTNCRELDLLVDCIICSEPLQGRVLVSCKVCGNIMCQTCSEKVRLCPFCRCGGSRDRNLAMERVLVTLSLPCRYARWGCKERLRQVERPSHESLCQFSPIACPLSRLCSWQGLRGDVVEHLSSKHSLIPVNGANVTLCLADFRKRVDMSDRKWKKYAVSLNCHSATFVSKIYFFQKKLRITFHAVSNEVEDNRQFGAWIEVRSHVRVLKGILPATNNALLAAPEIELPCSSLVSYCNKQGQLEIGITVRPIL